MSRSGHGKHRATRSNDGDRGVADLTDWHTQGHLRGTVSLGPAMESATAPDRPPGAAAARPIPRGQDADGKICRDDEAASEGGLWHLHKH